LRLFELASHGINLEEFHEEQVYWSLLGIEFPSSSRNKFTEVYQRISSKIFPRE
jgi:hypothetical protein